MYVSGFDSDSDSDSGSGCGGLHFGVLCVCMYHYTVCPMSARCGIIQWPWRRRAFTLGMQLFH
jgi:hypothetical protein